MHKHHIIPKHAGGDNDQLNLTPPISFRLHAMFHYDRWKHVGDYEDFIAYRMLLGRMKPDNARLEASKVACAKSEAYKNRPHIKPVSTSETCSKGGKIASQKLVEWQRKNAAAFKLQSSINGKNRKNLPWSELRRAAPTYKHTQETRARISKTMRTNYIAKLEAKIAALKKK